MGNDTRVDNWRWEMIQGWITGDEDYGHGRGWLSDEVSIPHQQLKLFPGVHSLPWPAGSSAHMGGVAEPHQVVPPQIYG